MKKLKDILTGKGVYLIAIVCVALVCTVGLYISNLSNKEDKPDPNIVVPSDDQDVIAQPKETSSPTSAKTPAPTSASTGTSSSQPTKTPGKTSPEKTPPGAALKMAMPIEGEILVDYAMDKLVFSKTLNEWKTHPGIDIAGEFGAPVKAAADGKVIDAKKDPRYGYLVILEHTNGIKTVYANLKEEIAVKINQNVKQGDVIGWIGRTSTFESGEDTHLHFEVLYNDNCVNVWNYLPKQE